MSTPTTTNALQLRRVLGRKTWGAPTPFGPDGWMLPCLTENGAVIVTTSPLPMDDGNEYTHASMSFADRKPTYDELDLLHKAAFGEGYAYQVFVGGPAHVNIHENALHLWGRADGKPMLVNFGILGTI